MWCYVQLLLLAIGNWHNQRYRICTYYDEVGVRERILFLCALPGERGTKGGEKNESESDVDRQYADSIVAT